MQFCCCCGWILAIYGHQKWPTSSWNHAKIIFMFSVYNAYATFHSHYKHLAPRKGRRKNILRTMTHYNIYTNISHLYIVTSIPIQPTCHTLGQNSAFLCLDVFGEFDLVEHLLMETSATQQDQQERWLTLCPPTMLVMLVTPSSLKRGKLPAKRANFY